MTLNVFIKTLANDKIHELREHDFKETGIIKKGKTNVSFNEVLKGIPQSEDSVKLNADIDKATFFGTYFLNKPTFHDYKKYIIFGYESPRLTEFLSLLISVRKKIQTILEQGLKSFLKHYWK
jgi:hypothetical protein